MDIKGLISIIKTVLAIEILEYEDKNQLSGSDKTRSEEKQQLLSKALTHLKLED